jgi:hypothetical protein
MRRKRLIPSTERDYSQWLRLEFQLGFLALNFWIGVKYHEHHRPQDGIHDSPTQEKKT